MHIKRHIILNFRPAHFIKKVLGNAVHSYAKPLLWGGLVGCFLACSDEELVTAPQSLEDSIAMSVHYKGVIAGLEQPVRTRVMQFGKYGEPYNETFRYIAIEKPIKTRNTIDSVSNWKNMISREMSVLQGGKVYGNFHVDANGHIFADMGPFIFASPSTTSAQAWYPSTGTDSIKNFSVKRNQSLFANLERSDLMYGEQATPSNVINFKHKMAQIEVHITVMRFYQDKDTIDTIYSPIRYVKLANVVTAGKVDIDNMDYPSGIVPDHSSVDTITCYHYVDSDYYDPTDNGFGDTVYSYRGIIFPQDTAFTIMIDVAGHKYEGKVEHYSYEDGVLYNIYGNLREQVEFKVGDYLCVNKNGDINFATDYNIDSIYNDGYHPIGVIFSDLTSDDDTEEGWKRGYAMALCDAGGGATHAWSMNRSTTVQTRQFGTGYERALKFWNGYEETHHIVDNAAYDSTLYPAFFAAARYRTKYMPSMGMSSNWFLPCVGQWYLILTNLGKPTNTTINAYGGYFSWTNQRAIVSNNINKRLTVVGPYTSFHKVWPSGTLDHLYWTSSEGNYYYGIYVGGDSNSDDAWDDYLCFYSWNHNKRTKYFVRPIIAF